MRAILKHATSLAVPRLVFLVACLGWSQVMNHPAVHQLLGAR